MTFTDGYLRALTTRIQSGSLSFHATEGGSKGDSWDEERAAMAREILRLRHARRAVDEALNSGDGRYQP